MTSVYSQVRTASIVVVLVSAIAGCMAVYPGVAFGQTSGPVYTTTGVYDAPGNANAVDAIAVGTNVGITGLVSAGADSLTIMAPHFATAYTNNAGGVIDFDLVSAPSELTNRFFGVYGQNNLFLISVTRNDLDGSGGGLNTNSNNPVISGTNYLGISNGANFDITYSQPLIEFGITALSRGADRTGVMTIRYSDGSTPYNFAAETILAANDDTFFGHLAPVGKFISGISWVSHNSPVDPTPNDNNFVRWDDLGFSTSTLAPCDVDGLNGCTTADAEIIRQHLLETGVGRSLGDITGDGIVNLLDFKLWKSLAGSGGGSVLNSGVIPEPGSWSLVWLALAGAWGGCRFRRHLIWILLIVFAPVFFLEDRS